MSYLNWISQWRRTDTQENHVSRDDYWEVSPSDIKTHLLSKGYKVVTSDTVITNVRRGIVLFVPHGSFKEKIFSIDMSMVLGVNEINGKTFRKKIFESCTLIRSDSALTNDGRHINYEIKRMRDGTLKALSIRNRKRGGRMLRKHGNPSGKVDDARYDQYYWGVEKEKGTLYYLPTES